MHGRGAIDNGVLHLRAFGGGGERAEQADDAGGHGARGLADQHVEGSVCQQNLAANSSAIQRAEQTILRHDGSRSLCLR